MTKLFNFKAQKNVGEQGELIFLKKFPQLMRLGLKDDYDFIDNATGQKVELKTDTYGLKKTKNHFIERFSDSKTKKDGGPFRCAEENSIFVYYHITDDVAFFYNPKKLVEIVEATFKITDLIPIRNIGYTTLGYKVPRELLKEALLQVTKLKD